MKCLCFVGLVGALAALEISILEASIETVGLVASATGSFGLFGALAVLVCAKVLHL